MRTVVTGSTCTGRADTDATSNGNTAQATTTGTANCQDDERFVYTVQVGEIDYELMPTHAPAAIAAAFVPFGGLTLRGSSLKNSLPGTPVKVRSDGGVFYVRLKNRESRYRVYAAR